MIQPYLPLAGRIQEELEELESVLERAEALSHRRAVPPTMTTWTGRLSTGTVSTWASSISWKRSPAGLTVQRRPAPAGIRICPSRCRPRSRGCARRC